MTDEEKKIQRHNLKGIRKRLLDEVNNIDLLIGEMCHTFTEDDLLKLGWTRHHFSGSYMAYEYKKDRKYLIFLDKSGDVLSYDGSPTRSFQDIQELIEYGQ